MKIKFTKKHKDAVTPIRATDGAIGYDLIAVEKKELGYGLLSYDTGIAVFIPKGWVGLMVARSSVSKTGLILINGVGVIDNDYRGTLQFRFYKLVDKEDGEYRVGDRIGQILFLPVAEIEFEESDKLDDTLRGDGGFGSTGNK